MKKTQGAEREKLKEQESSFVEKLGAGDFLAAMMMVEFADANSSEGKTLFQAASKLSAFCY